MDKLKEIAEQYNDGLLSTDEFLNALMFNILDTNARPRLSDKEAADLATKLLRD